jgi:hypothetical protein
LVKNCSHTLKDDVGRVLVLQVKGGRDLNIRSTKTWGIHKSFCERKKKYALTYNYSN